MKEAEYKVDTPAEKAFKALLKWNPCKEAVTHFKNTHGKTIKDMAENTSNQSWAAWALQTYGKELDSEVRKIYISKISDLMMAFSLYLDLPYLTGEEDVLLEAKFKGLLPTAEKELKDGIVTRAKWQ